MREQASRLQSSEGPRRLLAETASSNSVSRLPGRARAPLSAIMLSAFRMAALPQPQPTSSIHTATKVNIGVPPRGGPRCPAVDTVCADGERLAGRKGLHLQKVIALEPSGALLWLDDFLLLLLPLSSSLPSALLKPCLDLFTQWMEPLWQGGGCSSDKHKHVNSGQQRPLTFTGYLPSGRLLVTRPEQKK